GLPMFAHGQIEGFSERYGMEYARAYYNETPDEYLIARHEREIFPLLKRRYLFAEVDNFYLYDFFTPEGKVDENVFAFSNRYGEERALVIYHNKFATTRGWIRTSVAFLENGRLVQRTLAEGLGISSNPKAYTIFRDFISGLEFIRANTELAEKGMYFELHAYKYAVFLDFREVIPTRLKPYDELARLLNGQGVPSIEDEVMHLSLRPVHQAFASAIEPEVLRELMQGWLYGKIHHQSVALFKEKLNAILLAKDAVENHIGGETRFVEQSAKRYIALMTLAHLESTLADEWTTVFRELLPADHRPDSAWRAMLIWLFVQHLDAVRQTAVDIHLNVVQDWRLEKFIVQSLTQQEQDEARARTEAELIRLLVERERYTGETRDLRLTLKGLIESRTADHFLGVNEFQGVEYFNRERFLVLANAFYLVSAVEDLAEADIQLTPALREKFGARYGVLQQLAIDAEQCGYRLREFLKTLSIEILESVEAPIAETESPTPTPAQTARTRKKVAASAAAPSSSKRTRAKKVSAAEESPITSELSATLSETKGKKRSTRASRPASAPQEAAGDGVARSMPSTVAPAPEQPAAPTVVKSKSAAEKLAEKAEADQAALLSRTVVQTAPSLAQPIVSRSRKVSSAKAQSPTVPSSAKPSVSERAATVAKKAVSTSDSTKAASAKSAKASPAKASATKATEAIKAAPKKASRAPSAKTASPKATSAKSTSSKSASSTSTSKTTRGKSSKKGK
ncbi:MAG: hypothetical protein RMI34_10580, partial [Chloroherpetonaceae bacterium]|nr:hypothetical protein [Chloroherpetonaceae bacterium]MDW8020507.1 hypothetical protein [Chloroherpetonaceae bacterium]